MRAKPGHLNSDSRRGVTLVEFAVVFPIVLAFILGLFEISVVARKNSGLKSALAKGIREASIPVSSNADIEQEIRTSLLGVGVQDVDIVVTPANINPTVSSITIKVGFDDTPENGFLFGRFYEGRMERTINFHRM